MRLYLVQHGEATDKSENPDRPLTEAGRSNVKAVANLLRNSGLKVPKIEHSGKTRARETAELLAEAVGNGTEVHERKDISPNDPVDIVASFLKRADADLMLVGHLPFMGKLASLLVTGDPYAEVVTFQKGAVACLESDEKGAWHIVWMVVPQLAGS